MADKIRGPKMVFETEIERKLRMCLERALTYEWKSRPEVEGKPSGRLLVLANRFAVHEFFDLMMRNGDDGYVVGATLFARRADEMERPVRARFLTSLARMLRDFDGDPQGCIRESEVAHFGRFVNVLLSKKGRLDGVVLAWVEDMNTSDPENDLTPQPTAVIRGVLFSPSFDQRQAFGFWERAARSARFPVRIFSDPCAPEDGLLFSSYHVRAFGLFFSVAPEGAITRFAAHMRDNAVTKTAREWVEDAGRWMVKAVPASALDRHRVFDGIVGYVDGDHRREKLRALLHVA